MQLLRYIFILSALSMFSMAGFSQSISGPSSANQNETKSYSFTNGFMLSDPSWEAVGGTIMSTSQSGTTYMVDVKWTLVSSNDKIRIKNGASVVAEKTVNVIGLPLSGGTISGNQTICSGSTPSTLANVTIASGGSLGKYQYQWQQKSGSTWSDISGATATSYSPPAQTATKDFRRKVTKLTETAYSNTVTVTVIGTVSGGTISGSQTICYNGNPSAFTSSSSNANYSYQWQTRTPGGSWSNISGATSTTYDQGALTSTKEFRRRATACSQTAYSNTLTVTVYAQLTAGSVAGNQTICYYTAPAQLTSSVSPTGGNGAYTYLWQERPPGGSWVNAHGINTMAVLNPSALTSSKEYRRRVSSCSETKYSNTITVNVYDPLSAGSISAATQVCYGSNTTISNAQSATGGNGITYSWEKFSGGSWVAISGSSSSITLSNLTTTTSYRRKATSCGQTFNTIAIIIEVLPSLSGGTISGSQTVCYGGDPTIFTNSSGAGGGDSNYSYQWQTRTPGGSWGDITGATSVTYNQGTLTTTMEYRRKVTSCSQTAYSNTLTVTVNPQLSPGSIGGTQTICSGEALTALTNIGTPTGGDGSYSYQWQQKPTGGSWVDASGNSTLASYQPPSTLGLTTEYRRKVSSCSQESYSNTVTITVNITPLVSSYDFDIFNDDGFTLIGGRPEGGVWSGTHVTNGSFDAVTAGVGTYYVQYDYSVPSTGCSGSTISSVSVQTPPILNNNTSVRMSSGSLLSIDPGFQGYQWYKDNVPIDGATSSTFAVAEEGMYSVDVSTNNDTHRTNQVYVDIIDASPDQNYVLSRTFLLGVQDEALIGDTSIVQQTNYFDGLGRPMQTVLTGQSPLGNDMVQPVAYDEYGRQAKQYLPYVAGEAKGTYKTAAIDPVTYSNSDQYNFYTNASDDIVDDTSPFSERMFESSPFNRVTEIYGPGEAWRSSNKRVQLRYEINTVADHVISWEVDPANEDRVVKTTVSEYPAELLLKNVMVDEEGNEVQKFGSKTGQMILKRVEAPSGWADTYYVYDDFGSLRFVLPPEAVANYATDYSSDPETFLADWAFQYKYDDRKRMVEKRVPGAGWEYVVYDNHDRVVLTQDANQRVNNQWLFVKYDALNRPVATGIYEDATHIGQVAMQTYVNGEIGTTSTWFETTGTAIQGYTNTSFPTTSTEADYLSIIYYDNYAVTDSWTGYGYSNPSLSMHTNDDYSTPSSRNENVKGLVTGGLIRDLENDTWLHSVTYYDTKYRVAQTVMQNHVGGTDRQSNLYDFVGKVLQTKAVHADNTDTYTTLQTNTYDRMGRLLEVRNKLGTEPEVTLVRYSYNKLGELIENNLHSEDGNSFAQSVDYAYNIRGWLTHINDPDLSDGEGDYFGMQLMYNDQEAMLGNSGLYNGNISAVKWASGIAGSEEQAYTFAYDPMNRLTAANSKKNTGTWTAGNTDVTVGDYDLNGNIKAITRQNAAGTMDNMTYDYGAGGNRLQFVSDNGDITEGFVDGNTSGNDFSYDANGNMKEDKNKDITSITYNVLNLPERVDKGNGQYITYSYDAAGTKRSREVHAANGDLLKKIDYAGAYVYETEGTGSRELKYIQMQIGRIIPGTTSEYQYYLTDHLGNVRTVFTTAPKTDEYLATMETENIGVGTEDLFTRVNETRGTSSAANHTAGGDEAAELDDTKPVGPGIIIPVFPGDTLDLEVWGYYEGGSGYNTATPAGMVTSIADAFGGVSGGAGEAGAIYNGLSGALAALGFGGTSDDSRPAAYLNYIVLDKDYNYVNDNAFGYVQMPANASFNKQLMSLPDILISKVGYIFVYVTYESQVHNRVYFDDLKITHHQSAIVQNNDYYPFGLQHNTSWTRSTVRKNNRLFNGGSEYNEETELYETFFRNYDPVLGRFNSIDVMAGKYASLTPYNFGFNNPNYWNDFWGADPEEDIWNKIDDLMNSDYGGSWTPGGGTAYFGSFAEGFAAGWSYNNYFNSWDNIEGGQAGAANRFADSMGGDVYQDNNGNYNIVYTSNHSYVQTDRAGNPVENGKWGGKSTYDVLSLDGIVNGESLDGMDYANNTASLTGTIVGGAQFVVGAAKNQSLWNVSYKAHKVLKSVGVQVQTRAIKHGAKTVLANASKKVAIVGAAIAVTDIILDGEIRASHILNITMVGVSAIPVVGWIAGGIYFGADMITLGVTGQSIGGHLDNYVGSPLISLK